MPTNPEYGYTHIFGVENYDAKGVAESAQTGGGAEETNDNLVSTFWQITTFDGDVPTDGLLLKPVSAFGDYTAAPSAGALIGFPNVGSGRQVFKSRTSARVLLAAGDKSIVNWNDQPLMAIVNPPQDMKQRLTNALSVVAASNPQGWTLTYHKTMLELSAWAVAFAEDSVLLGADVLLDGLYLAGAANGLLPLCRTNGADGNFPSFFGSAIAGEGYTVSQLRELIAALDSGNFFVPIIIQPFNIATTPIRLDIHYPQSVGRSS